MTANADLYRGRAIRMVWSTGFPADYAPCRCNQPVEQFAIPYKAGEHRAGDTLKPDDNCAVVWRCTKCQTTIVDTIVMSYQCEGSQ